MNRKILIAAAAAAILAAVAGVSWAAASAVVDQKGLAFSTAALTVAKGTIVEFNNSDSTPHNILITGPGTNIDGGLQQPGVSYKAPFLKAGVFDVVCGIHPKMHMTVTVQ
jgi:cytochrome c peroxidase